MKKLIKKVKNLIVGILYSIPFGMKGANDEMFYSKASSLSDGTGIHQQQESNSLCNDLLNTRVTEEVQNLRYRTYFVAEEARNYKYYGGERAAKIGRIIPKNPNIIKFSQENKIIIESVLDEINRINEYSEDNFTLKIITKEFPLFKLERYIHSFKVNLNKEINEYFISFKFPKFYSNDEEISYKIFYNMLKDNNIDGKLSFIKELKLVEFITYNVDGINDFTKFTLNTAKLVKIYGDNDYTMIDYICDNYESINLLEKYYKEDLANKYKNKEKKKNTTLTISFGDDENNTESKYTKHCEICGKPISNFDAKMSYDAVNKELCLDCLSTMAKS